MATKTFTGSESITGTSGTYWLVTDNFTFEKINEIASDIPEGSRIDSCVMSYSVKRKTGSGLTSTGDFSIGFYKGSSGSWSNAQGISVPNAVKNLYLDTSFECNTTHTGTITLTSYMNTSDGKISYSGATAIGFYNNFMYWGGGNEWSASVTITWTYAPPYTVTWKNHDGTLLDTDTVLEGDTPQYTGSTPTKESDAQYHYTHSGWSPTVGAITGDTTYTALFDNKTLRQYTVTCMAGGVGGGTVRGYEANKLYNYGTELELEAISLYDHIEFEMWSDTLDTSAKRKITVVDNMSYIAIFKYKSFTVTFDPDNNGASPIETKSVTYGGTVTPPADPELADTAEWDYIFVGWFDEVNKRWWSESTTITSDVTYTAQYDRVKRTYTVYWYNWDLTLLGTTENVEYDTAPTYYGETPTREPNDYYTYQFIGWSPDPNEGIKGKTDYFALYRWIDRTYDVHWVNASFEIERLDNFLAEGTITQANYDRVVEFIENPELLALEKDEVKYDTQPDYDEALHGIPVHPLQGIDPEYEYSFIGWRAEVTHPAKPDTELETVKGNITYTAMYSMSKIEYAITITIYNSDSTYTTNTSSRAYGDIISINALQHSPVGYKFTQWTDGNTESYRKGIKVTGVAEYTAEYERLPIPFKCNIEQVAGVYIVPDTNNLDTGDIVYVVNGAVPEVTVKAERVDGWRFIVSNTIPDNSYPLKRIYKNGTRVW